MKASFTLLAILSTAAPINSVLGFGEGLVNGAKHLGSGLVNTVVHPIQTIKGVGHIIAHPIKTVKAGNVAIKAECKAKGTAECLGDATFGLASTLTPFGAVKAISAIGGAAKVTEVGADVGAVATKVKVAPTVFEPAPPFTPGVLPPPFTDAAFPPLTEPKVKFADTFNPPAGPPPGLLNTAPISILSK